MAKNPRRQQAVTAAKPIVLPLFSRRGKIMMAVGGLFVVTGFFLLSFTDPSGRNWASHFAPFCLVLGYTLIGFGIVQKTSI